MRPTSEPPMQPLVDTEAWSLVHRRSPFLARAVYHLLEAGRPAQEVIDTARASCSDPALRPILACAVYGCSRLRQTNPGALFGEPSSLLTDLGRGRVH